MMPGMMGCRTARHIVQMDYRDSLDRLTKAKPVACRNFAAVQISNQPIFASDAARLGASSLSLSRPKC
jgi:hypothetical protein